MNNIKTYGHSSKTIHLTMTLVAAFFAFAVSPADADFSNSRFQPNHSEDGVEMSLRGTGLKQVIFVKAFVAGFYQVPGAEADVLEDVAKRIEVEYFVNIPGRKLNRFTIQNMKANVTPETFDSIENEVKEMGKYFVDLKPGDRFSLTYIPNVGTKFAHNGELVGTITGREFARALFAVWVGERPFDEGLKNQILGAAPESDRLVRAKR